MILGLALMTSIAFGQKKNETQAAIEYKTKYLPAMQQKDYATAKKHILSAKEFIDMAAAHEDTKSREKTLYYKTEIYLGIMALSLKTPEDAEVAAMVNEDNINAALGALKAGMAVKKKYKSEFNEAVYRARSFFDNSGNGLYNDKKYKEAASMYSHQVAFSNAGGVLDSNAMYYYSVCAEKAGDYANAAKTFNELAKMDFKGATTYYLAADAYRKGEMLDQAKSVVAEGRAKFPNDRDLLMMLVTINIDAGDKEGAEAALQNAIEADPENKTLYYIIGTIYMELQQNEKAEAALRKAVELDPEYALGQYQLGAHLIAWASDLKTQANQLDMGDVNYDLLMAKSDEMYKKAVAPLEKYVEKEPNEKAVIKILYQVHNNLGNEAKAKEYKAKYDAL